MTDQRLMEIFKHFDVDDTDYISRENILEAMVKLGKDMTEEEINEAFLMHDITHDGKMSFEEFK